MKIETIFIAPPEIGLAEHLLTQFRKKSLGKNELDRIREAKRLTQLWNQNQISKLLLPAVPEKNDYWYLVQLLATNSHLNQTNKPISTFFSDTQFYFIPQAESLFHSINTELPLTRNQLETFLKQHEPMIISSLSLSPQKYAVSLPTYSEMLILGYLDYWPNKRAYCHLAGYRVDRHNRKLGLTGGVSLLGGSRFVDSYFLDKSLNTSWFPLIVKKK